MFEPYPVFGGPQSAGDPLVSADYSTWWSRGLDIVRRGWRPLAVLQAVGLVLAVIVTGPIAAFGALADENAETLTSVPDEALVSVLLAALGLTIAAVLATVLVAAIITVATVHVVVSVAVGVPVQLGEALRLGARRVFPLIGWQILAAPILLAGLCACVLPVFYVAAIFTILPVVVAIERTNVISRCFSLFHHDVGAAASRTATILGLTIGTGIVGGLLGEIFNAVIMAATPGSTGLVGGALVSTVISSVISGAVAVLTAPLIVTAYADLRARRDQTDGATIAREIGVVAPAI